ncbi:MAG: hypothetical protein IPK35_10595 [Saprospiraceae bacterium]|nr:hypothetical protein [Saprospiraceae bacterium]
MYYYVKFKRFYEVKLSERNTKLINGGGNYTSSHTRNGVHYQMDYENDDCTMDLWDDNGTKSTINCA